MHVLIAGGSGNIGKNLQKALLDKGYQVSILTRDSTRVLGKVSYIHWDGMVMPALHTPVDAIINLCGASIASDMWTDERQKKLLESRVNPTQTLVSHMAEMAKKPQVFINASAVGYYGDRSFELLTEESDSGKGFLAELSVEWEKAAINSHTRTVILRTGIVLEKGAGALPEALKTFPLGFGGYFGKGNQGFPWIHIQDEVGLIIHALENPAVEGPINLVAPESVSYKQFIETAAKIRSKLVVPAPEFVLNVMLGSRADLVLSSQYVYPKKAVQTGYQFKFPHLKEALEDLLN
ncbi:MAG: TIGR01777 family oxidoreductase [Bacteroidia bacterium]|nr:TIGR01777 family oxidoreductase [Bacteroidia bacterium]